MPTGVVSINYILIFTTDAPVISINFQFRHLRQVSVVFKTECQGYLNSYSASSFFCHVYIYHD